MTLEVRTTDLDRHKGISVVFGHNNLLTLAPGQTSAPGCLVLAGDATALAKITAATFRCDPPGALAVTLGARRPAGVDITLHARGHGPVILYVDKQAVASVTIGVHISHLGGGATDLLARASNGPDCRKIVAIQQILQSRAAPLIIDQRSGTYSIKDQLACGTVVQRAGTALFGTVDSANHQPYHKPITRRDGSLSWANIEYDPLRTQFAISTIKSILDRGTAVRLGAVYKPGPNMLAPNGALQAERGGGHTILAVGHFADRFLYLDPFPKGSKVIYGGGLPFNVGKVCDHLGVLRVSTERGPHLKADPLLETELGEMEIISGPLH